MVWKRYAFQEPGSFNNTVLPQPTMDIKVCRATIQVLGPPLKLTSVLETYRGAFSATAISAWEQFALPTSMTQVHALNYPAFDVIPSSVISLGNHTYRHYLFLRLPVVIDILESILRLIDQHWTRAHRIRSQNVVALTPSFACETLKLICKLRPSPLSSTLTQWCPGNHQRPHH